MHSKNRMPWDAMGETFWPCYRRDKARALYISKLQKRCFVWAVQPTKWNKVPTKWSDTFTSSASEIYSLRTKQEDVF